MWLRVCVPWCVNWGRWPWLAVNRASWWSSSLSSSLSLFSLVCLSASLPMSSSCYPFPLEALSLPFARLTHISYTSLKINSSFTSFWKHPYHPRLTWVHILCTLLFLCVELKQTVKHLEVGKMCLYPVCILSDRNKVSQGLKTRGIKLGFIHTKWIWVWMKLPRQTDELKALESCMSMTICFVCKNKWLSFICSTYELKI